MCREAHEGELTVEDVTPNTASLLVFSRRGYLKRMRADLFSPQACPTSSFTSQSLKTRLRVQAKATVFLQASSAYKPAVKLYALSTYGMSIQRTNGGGRTAARREGRGGRAAARGRRRGGGGAGDGPRHGAVFPPGRPVPLAQGAPGPGGLAHVRRHRHCAGAPTFPVGSDSRVFKGTNMQKEKPSQAVYELAGRLKLGALLLPLAQGASIILLCSGPRLPRRA